MARPKVGGHPIDSRMCPQRCSLNHSCEMVDFPTDLPSGYPNQTSEKWGLVLKSGAKGQRYLSEMFVVFPHPGLQSCFQQHVHSIHPVTSIHHFTAGYCMAGLERFGKFSRCSDYGQLGVETLVLPRVAPLVEWSAKAQGHMSKFKAEYSNRATSGIYFKSFSTNRFLVGELL